MSDTKPQFLHTEDGEFNGPSGNSDDDLLTRDEVADMIVKDYGLSKEVALAVVDDAVASGAIKPVWNN